MSRGRGAHSPMKIPAKGWLDVGWRVWTRLGRNQLGLIAAGVAFYGLLSLFPAISAAVALIGLMFDATLLLDQTQFLLSALPAEADEMIATQIAQVSNARTESLGLAAIIATAIALWSASKGMGSVMAGLNIINNESEERGFVMVKAVTLGLTLALIVVLSLAVLVVAGIPAALLYIGASQTIADWALILRWPAMFGIGVFAIAALYRYGPSRRPAKWRWLSPGALLACALWVAGSFGFSLYVESFASYNETFGTLAGVIIMLTWLWLSAFVVLLGALLDAEIEAQTACDSTIGPSKPMGERGAFKADNLGEKYGEAPRR